MFCVPLPWCTSQSTISTRRARPELRRACTATATLLYRQKPERTGSTSRQSGSAVSECVSLACCKRLLCSAGCGSLSSSALTLRLDDVSVVPRRPDDRKSVLDPSVHDSVHEIDESSDAESRRRRAVS